jgi:peptidoglycan/LPS O-acetylase OafA/YrhL
MVVVLNHSILAFWPKYYGLGPALPGGSQTLQGQLYYAFINGPAAVCLFFVLSGYVLTRRYCQTGDTAILMKGAVKRWPRLMGPVFVTVLISYALFYFNLYRFQQAAAVSGSPWLALFGGSFTQSSGPPLTVAVIHWRGALAEGSYLTFFRGDALFDSSLWTMRPEFLGSLLAFGAAPILLQARKASVFATIWLTAIAVLLLHYAEPILEAFPLGVAMAVLLPRGLTVKWYVAWPLLLASLYLMGYPNVPVGAYLHFGSLVIYGMPSTDPMVFGAVLMICTLETFPPLRRLFSGRVPAALGQLSFPVYLLHALVIFSAGSAVYLRHGGIAATATVFAVTLVAALPLVWFNNVWVAQVNACANFLLRQRS